MKSVLITGAFGFVGRHTASVFKDNGYYVVGIGNGNWAREEYSVAGLDEWLDSNVSIEALLSMEKKYDVIVHCAGNGSVSFSITNPMQDFQKTVTSTVAVLEFIRLKNSEARFIYLSSAAVYGAQPNCPIREDTSLNPVSPYGYYKKIAEDLCAMYRHNFGLDICVIRFYSIYGNGLKKQLLWDACNRLSVLNVNPSVFYGTGDEIRDFIHVLDAARLIVACSKYAEYTPELVVINGGSGEKTSIKKILDMIGQEIESDVRIEFNGINRPGDPCYYHADISKALSMGWRTEVALAAGVRDYAQWFMQNKFR